MIRDFLNHMVEDGLLTPEHARRARIVYSRLLKAIPDLPTPTPGFDIQGDNIALFWEIGTSQMMLEIDERGAAEFSFTNKATYVDWSVQVGKEMPALMVKTLRRELLP